LGEGGVQGGLGFKVEGFNALRLKGLGFRVEGCIEGFGLRV